MLPPHILHTQLRRNYEKKKSSERELSWESLNSDNEYVLGSRVSKILRCISTEKRCYVRKHYSPGLSNVIIIAVVRRVRKLSYMFYTIPINGLARIHKSKICVRIYLFINFIFHTRNSIIFDYSLDKKYYFMMFISYSLHINKHEYIVASETLCLPVYRK